MRAAKWATAAALEDERLHSRQESVRAFPGSRVSEAPASVDHRNKKVRLDDRADRTPEERRIKV